LNTKVAPKIMLINSKSFKVINKQVLPLLASKYNNLGFKQMFFTLQFNFTSIACDNEHVCDANAHALGC
jgi:hypothetical protein